MGFFEKLKNGLLKTKNAIVGKIDNLFRSFHKIDEDLFDELEELLISADLGVNCTEEILDNLRETVKDGRFGLANVAPTVVKMMGLNAPSCWEESMI